MIIPISRTKTESDVVFEHMGLRAWRWVLQVGVGHVSVDMQLRHNGSAWRTVHTWLGANFTKHFRLGQYHTWYDGPHCFFSLGWLHFFWEGALFGKRRGRCAECEGELS